MKLNRKTLVRWKIYWDRARTYISYVQFLGTVYIVLKLMQNSPLKTWIFNNWIIAFPLIFVVFIGACILLGYIEALFKIREYEQVNYAEANPEWVKLNKKIDKLIKLIES